MKIVIDNEQLKKLLRRAYSHENAVNGAAHYLLLELLVNSSDDKELFREFNKEVEATDDMFYVDPDGDLYDPDWDLESRCT